MIITSLGPQGIVFILSSSITVNAETEYAFFCCIRGIYKDTIPESLETPRWPSTKTSVLFRVFSVLGFHNLNSTLPNISGFRNIFIDSLLFITIVVSTGRKLSHLGLDAYLFVNKMMRYVSKYSSVI